MKMLKRDSNAIPEALGVRKKLGMHNRDCKMQKVCRFLNHRQ